MKILWAHNYNRKSPLSGVNMRELIDPLKAAGMEIVPYDLGMSNRDLLCGKAVLARLAEAAEGCDIVHAQYGSACGWMVSKLNHPRKILSLKGSDLHGPIVPWGKRKFFGCIARFLTLSSLKGFDRVVVMSSRMRADVARYYRPEAIVLLPDGMDVSRFGRLGREEARKVLGMDREELQVLFVCVFTDDVVKRYPLAQAAVKELRKKLPGVRLITMTGIARDQVPAYFSACDVVLVTSSHEGWPNSIKEALASNRPFVATDVSDLRDIAHKTLSCRISGDTPKSIANALHEVLTSPAKGDNLRPLAQEFDYTHYVPRLIELYQSVLNN